MPLITKPFDAARYITTVEAQQELLEDAFLTGDPTYIADALAVVAQARGLTPEAEKGAQPGDLTLGALLDMAKALGFRLQMAPLQAPAAE